MDKISTIESDDDVKKANGIEEAEDDDDEEEDVNARPGEPDDVDMPDDGNSVVI